MKSEMEATNRYIAWRRSVLLAWKQGTSEVDLQWARHCPGAWLSGVLDDEEQAAYLQNLPVTEIDCIGRLTMKNVMMMEPNVLASCLACNVLQGGSIPNLLAFFNGYENLPRPSAGLHAKATTTTTATTKASSTATPTPTPAKLAATANAASEHVQASTH